MTKESWKGGKGHINEQMVSLLPPPGDDTLVLLCGPISMTNTLTQIVHRLGYTNKMVHPFV